MRSPWFGAIGVRALGVETVIHVIVDQNALGVRHGLLDGLELLGHVEARLADFEHLDHRPSAKHRNVAET